ncbi:hypothetical protein M422DRAFT_71831 [Sphaerobolus stellatus SS14]|uniref:Uncharacterized protein n=1 Tax=Sphaerobolus stellatus (strain SS14) TaxID=990650 RepID=A0A0C9UMS0_SPHS4|nr:hypothetical protein M422DRAFT_71831 [Sphaerobolus stellatus SS14]
MPRYATFLDGDTPTVIESSPRRASLRLKTQIKADSPPPSRTVASRPSKLPRLKTNTAAAAKPTKNVSSTKSKASGKAGNILVSRKVLETLSKKLGLRIAALTTQASRVNKDKLSVDKLLE